nr:MAG TPA: hypothetical protein [Caudoviricetes sp.]
MYNYISICYKLIFVQKLLIGKNKKNQRIFHLF